MIWWYSSHSAGLLYLFHILWTQKNLIIWVFSLPSSIILPCNGLDVDNTTTFFFPFDFVLLRCQANVFLLLFKMTNCTKILSFLGVKKFLSRIFVADLHYPQVLRIAVFHLSTCHWVGINFFLFTAQFIKIFTCFIIFTFFLCQQSFI